MPAIPWIRLTTWIDAAKVDKNRFGQTIARILSTDILQMDQIPVQFVRNQQLSTRSFGDPAFGCLPLTLRKPLPAIHAGRSLRRLCYKTG
jgi:hypothetical protein